MGCDGGSIPHRSEMVHTKKKAIKIDSTPQKTAQWLFCALSKKPLVQPIVSCAMGKLYNREAVLEYLINPQLYGEAQSVCPHVKSIKDVKTLKVTENTDNNESSAVFTGTREIAKVYKFICSVTMKEMNGTTRFCYINSCGCLMSESALKEINGNQCLACGEIFEKEDIIPVYPDRAEDIERLTARMNRIKTEGEKVNAEKKLKKLTKKKKSVEENTSAKKIRLEIIEALETATSKDYNFEKVNSNLNLPSLASLNKHKSIDSNAVQSLYLQDTEKKLTNPLFSGTFTRRM